MIWIEIGAGLALLLGGGEALVRGAADAAARLGVSRLLIGLTLVGFGTSTPELLASVEGALAGSPGIALGNVVGSNIANILLILGVGAALRPLVVDRGAFNRDALWLGGAAAALAMATVADALQRGTGIVFLAGLALYLFATIRSERRRAASGPSSEPPPPTGLGLGPAFALAAAGAVALVFGADLLVGGALTIARDFGISEAVIGLTLVAIGTSLPELAATVVAALRREGDIALGNVVGSNIFNVFGIAGTTAIVAPIAAPPSIARFDIWAMLAATALLTVFARSRDRITRGEGAALLAAYAAYLGAQLLRAPG